MNAEEYTVKNLITQAHAYALKIQENEAYERLSQESIDKADQLMKERVHIIFQEFGTDTLIQMAEVALKVPQRTEIAQFYLDIFFKLR